MTTKLEIVNTEREASATMRMMRIMSERREALEAVKAKNVEA